MKTRFCVGLLLFALVSKAQEKAQNLFIITTDGVRWQEIFNGADSLLLSNPHFVNDTALAKRLYWDDSQNERRKKLLPFFWNVLAKEGQLYGNRQKESRVNVKNIYKISYPGYNELLSGYPDPLPILNAPQQNRNKTVLEFLAENPAFNDSVASFTSWNVFPFILNKTKSCVKQNCGYENVDDTTESVDVLNRVQNGVPQKNKTRYDLLTFFAAKQYIRQHHPRVVFLSLGETDEFAHQGRYDLYLQQLSAVDKMIAELWYAAQTDPVYKDKTTFLLSTDHGRGRSERWTTHHAFIRGSGEIWLGLLGGNIAPAGEMQGVNTIFQNQVAATAAFLLGEEFRSNRNTGKPINLPSQIEVAAGTKLSGANATVSVNK
ncbi:alkaline phosphatase family protein [Flavisolibacter ginsenosidimutans]|nr:alkaline phosphatase family protein [Flavisolibacter ginsenosidimutans]